jgi:(4S)-4-hydroxy-5-phosphonooxypentane-2,3-dione isomerase
MAGFAFVPSPHAIAIFAMPGKLPQPPGDDLPGPAQSVMDILKAGSLRGRVGWRVSPEIIPGNHREDRRMSKSVWVSAAAIALLAASAIMLPAPGQRVAAQSPGMFVNAVDLDIVPTEREKYLAAITENGMAAVKEPGCRRFDILNLASDPNHFLLYEVYDNEAAFQAHRATDHFKKYAATTASMVAKRDARPMSVIATNAQSK